MPAHTDAAWLFVQNVIVKFICEKCIRNEIPSHTHSHTHTLVRYQLHSKSTFVRVNFCALLLAAFIARSLSLPLFIIITYSGNHSEKRRIKCKEIYTIPRQSVRLKSTCTTELVNEPSWNWIRLRIRCQPAYSLGFSQIERGRKREGERVIETQIYLPLAAFSGN